MIDENSRNVYKSIKAPDTLREKVLSFEQFADDQAEEKQSNVRPSVYKYLRPAAFIAAACLVLIIGIAIPNMTVGSSDTVLINGTKIGKNPVCLSVEKDNQVATARSMETLVIPVNVLDKKQITMSVGSGSLQLMRKDGTILEEAESIQKNAQEEVQWLLNEGELDKNTTLTVTTPEHRMYYQVYQDETSGLYYITLKEKVNLK